MAGSIRVDVAVLKSTAKQAEAAAAEMTPQRLLQLVEVSLGLTVAQLEMARVRVTAALARLEPTETTNLTAEEAGFLAEWRALGPDEQAAVLQAMQGRMSDQAIAAALAELGRRRMKAGKRADQADAQRGQA